MVRGPLFRDDYRPQFSGHETFPLRYGWLKKAFDATAASSEDPRSKRAVFLADDAIAKFGVGKNMVASMRHWATSTDVIAEDKDSPDRIVTTTFGRALFGPRGHDPYMEHHATMWLLHWKVCANPSKTTWFWAFNHFGGSTFRRDDLVHDLLKLATLRGWQRVSETTVRRDVECFLRTYAAPHAAAGAPPEDALESPLAELGLVRAIGRRDDYQFARGSKPTLPDGVFAFALDEFWRRTGTARTLSFEMVAHEPGSPGRVFLLDEPSLADRLANLEGRTDSLFRWSETAGLRQVVRGREPDARDGRAMISNAYGSGAAEAST